MQYFNPILSPYLELYGKQINIKGTSNEIRNSLSTSSITTCPRFHPILGIFMNWLWWQAHNRPLKWYQWDHKYAAAIHKYRFWLIHINLPNTINKHSKILCQSKPQRQLDSNSQSLKQQAWWGHWLNSTANQDSERAALFFSPKWCPWARDP